MMQFVYFHDSDTLWDRIKESYSNSLCVAPSPSKADNLRSRLQAKGMGIDVLTINKFISTLIQEKGVELNLKRKSELYLIFGWLRPMYFPELTFEQFSNAYNLFSELRSFSLNLVALTPILEQQDAQVRKAIELFWNILEQTNFHDEHFAYSQLTESLRKEDLASERGQFIFWGFQHFNGLQIDFLKALSIRNDVLIPFPMALREKLKSSDWPSWLLDGLSNVECIDQEEYRPLTIRWRKTNSREISSQLKNEIKAQDQVVLGVSRIEDNHLHLLPYGATHFKIPHQLLDREISSYFSRLKEMSFSEFRDKLESDLLESIQKQNFKKVKVIQLIQEALASMDDLTDSKPRIDKFFIYLLKDVVSLNQPRTSYTSLNPGEERVELKSFSDIESIDLKRRVVFCLDERFGELVSLGQRYSIEMMAHLSVLGPLKRSELDLEFKKWELKEVIKENNTLLLMPKDLLKHSLSWSKILEGIDPIDEEFTLVKEERKISDFFSLREYKKFTGDFSASKVRSYLDCPRKFYFNYIEKKFPDVVLTTELDPRVKGNLSHKIIETAIRDSVEDIPTLAKTILDEEVKNLSLKDEEYQNNLIQISLRSQNGIQVLRKIEEILCEKANWVMEDKFSFEIKGLFRGQIDCYAVLKDYIILLDFKSTSSSAPTLTKIRSYEDIQLWTYLLGLESKGINIKGKTLIAGYVVLEEPSKSVLLFSDEAVSKDFKPFFSANPFKVDIDESLTSVKEKLNETLLLILDDDSFKAKPLSADVCKFCDFGRICMKGSVL